MIARLALLAAGTVLGAAVIAAAVALGESRRLWPESDYDA